MASKEEVEPAQQKASAAGSGSLPGSGARSPVENAFSQKLGTSEKCLCCSQRTTVAIICSHGPECGLPLPVRRLYALGEALLHLVGALGTALLLVPVMFMAADASDISRIGTGGSVYRYPPRRAFVPDPRGQQWQHPLLTPMRTHAFRWEHWATSITFVFSLGSRLLILPIAVPTWALEFGGRKNGFRGFEIGRVRTGCLGLVEKVQCLHTPL